MKLHQVTKARQTTSQEDLSAARTAVDGAKVIMGGAFHLHFYRPEGNLKWQVVTNKHNFHLFFLICSAQYCRHDSWHKRKPTLITYPYKVVIASLPISFITLSLICQPFVLRWVLAICVLGACW